MKDLFYLLSVIKCFIFIKILIVHLLFLSLCHSVLNFNSNTQITIEILRYLKTYKNKHTNTNGVI